MVHSSSKLTTSVIIAALLCGCATVSSRHVPMGSAPTRDAGGFTYFLPMRMAKFTATRMTLVKLEEAANAKAAKAKKAAEDKAKLDDQLKTAQAQLEEADDGKRPKLEAKVAELKGKVATAEAAEKALRAEADRAQAAFEDAKALGAPCTYTATLELMPPQADPHFRYVARMQHSGLRDDHLELKVTTAGLLTSSKVEATDRTGDILVEAFAAMSAFRAGGYQPSTPPGTYYLNLRDSPPPPRCATLPPQFHYVFDPIREGVSGLNMALLESEYPFSIDMTSSFGALAAAEAKWPAFPNVGRQLPGTDPAFGIYYRSATPVRFTLRRALTMGASDNPNPCAAKPAAERANCLAEASGWQPIEAVIANVPQAGPISYIPMTATAFVKSTDDV